MTLSNELFRCLLWNQSGRPGSQVPDRDIMKTILIVDDIKVNLKVLEVLLSRNGYAVLPALSAEKALVLLQNHPCDLIISDIQMPEMDGFQFCRLCQHDEQLRHIPFVFYSSTRDEKQIRHQARKVGALAVVRKPADPARLLKTIDKVLSGPPSRFRKQQPTADAVPVQVRQREADRFAPPSRIFGGADQERVVSRILDNVPGIVWTLDDKGDVIYISPAVERLTGFSVSRIREMGKSGWLNRVHPSDEKNVRMAFRRLFQERVPLDIVYRFECRDCRFMWFQEKSGIPLENETDGTIRVDGVTLDISARVQDQACQMTGREQALIHTFSQGISHDLDNLLTGIADYLQLSARTSSNSQERGRFLANALKISRRALALNRNIFLLSTQDEPVRKNSLFTRVIARVVRSLLEDSDIQYRMHMPRGLWPCRVDTRLMASAVEHVLVNACEAVAGKKDGLISVALQNRSVGTDPDDIGSFSCSHLAPGRYVQAVIQDNGCGMDEKSISQIFDPYFSSKPKGMENGVGLGLAVTRVILKRHGGGMAVDSRRHHGTKLKLFLPAEAEEAWYENRFDRG